MCSKYCCIGLAENEYINMLIKQEHCLSSEKCFR